MCCLWSISFPLFVFLIDDKLFGFFFLHHKNRNEIFITQTWNYKVLLTQVSAALKRVQVFRARERHKKKRVVESQQAGESNCSPSNRRKTALKKILEKNVNFFYVCPLEWLLSFFLPKITSSDCQENAYLIFSNDNFQHFDMLHFITHAYRREQHCIIIYIQHLQCHFLTWAAPHIHTEMGENWVQILWKNLNLKNPQFWNIYIFIIGLDIDR